MRVTRGFVAKNRRKRVLKLAKGFRGAHSSQYRVAQQTTLKALSLAYRHRRLKKRNFRNLWIRRIHAGLSSSAEYHGVVYDGKANPVLNLAPAIFDKVEGLATPATSSNQAPIQRRGMTESKVTLDKKPFRSLSYSLFIHSLKKSRNLLNRKILSQLAIFDPTSFQYLVSTFSAAQLNSIS